MNYNQAAEFGLQQLITRRLTTPGGLPAPTVAPEMFPCLTLENDRPEWGILKGERICAAAGSVGPVAAQNSAAGIFNPVGSNVIATVEELNVSPLASTVQVLLSQQALALAPLTPGVRDARWVVPGGTMARGVLSSQQGTAALVFADAVLMRFPASVFSATRSPFVIPPGWGLILLLSTVNVGLSTWSITWRERGAQPGELA